MARAYDPARRMRERLLMLEQRRDAEAIAAGVAETVGLSRARGAEIEGPAAGRLAHRRLTGLEWLARKGRISAEAATAGARYGQAYRRAKTEPSLPSTLNAQPGATGIEGPTVAQLLEHAEGTASARLRLALLRRRLLSQPDLVAACDQICGEERTPREAGGGEREGVRLEAVLKVALDILAAPEPTAPGPPGPRAR
jgi:hypothetical protein